MTRTPRFCSNGCRLCVLERVAVNPERGVNGVNHTATLSLLQLDILQVQLKSMSLPGNLHSVSICLSFNYITSVQGKISNQISSILTLTSVPSQLFEKIPFTTLVRVQQIPKATDQVKSFQPPYRTSQTHHAYT
jgi:hypothetical protein